MLLLLLGGVTGTSVWATVYLVVTGSLVAFSSYVWLLKNAPNSTIATYAYVNPVVAVALGALLLGEGITLAVVVGGLIAVLASGRGDSDGTQVRNGSVNVRGF